MISQLQAPTRLYPGARDLRQSDGYIPDLAALFNERSMVRHWEPVSYAWPRRVVPAVVGPGEMVEEAVRREVARQTGLHVRIRRLSGVYSEPETQVRSLPSGEVVQYIVNCFVCDVVETQHKPPVGTSLLFADPCHMPEPLSAHVRRWLADARSREVVVC